MSDAEDTKYIEATKPSSHSLGQQVDASANESGESLPFHFSLRSLLLATTVVALLVWGFRVVRDSAQQSMLERHIANSFKMVFLGLNNYESARGFRAPSARIDEAGTPLSSWRWQIIHYMTQLPNDGSAVWDAKASWQAPINKDPRSWSMDDFCWRSSASKDTTVFAIAGPSAAFQSTMDPDAPPLPSDVVLLMEIANSKTHWMQPGDYDVTKLLAATGRLGDTVKGLLPDCIHVLFADGEVWALSPDTPIDAVKPFFTLTSAKAASREESLSKYRVD
jgi:hypothetical protein